MNPVNSNSNDPQNGREAASGKSYDIAVIGSGPGGYVAGLYASRLKFNVCVIEKDLVGGACLNRGCVPTKSMLHSASIFSLMKHAANYGIDTGNYMADFKKVASRKDEVVLRLRTGIETLLRANKVDLVKGEAAIVNSNTVDVKGRGPISAKHIIIASGSKSASLPGIKIDETDILSSSGMIEIKQLPKRLAIIGGGIIGCEFASMFNAFGTKVTIIEFLDRLVATQSSEASKKLELIFKKNGIDVYTSVKAESAEKDAGIVRIKLSGGKVIEADKLLISVGRVPDTDFLSSLEPVGVKRDNGRIVVDEYLRTGAKDIYAIGDCIAGPLLAHKASYDAVLACDNIKGDQKKVDYSNIPNCIWTLPEIASVGMSEEWARKHYPDVKIAKFPFLASGKAYITGRTDGFVKIIGDSNGSILGVEIMGEGACDLIGEAVLAKTAGVKIKDWSGVVHGHPTMSEVFQEASNIYCGKAIHSI